MDQLTSVDRILRYADANVFIRLDLLALCDKEPRPRFMHVQDDFVKI